MNVRTRPILLSAAAALSLGCFGQDELPAKEPVSPQRIEVRKLPDHVKLFEGIARGGQPVTARGAPSGRVVEMTAQIAPAPRCGHIRVLPVPPEADPGFIIQLPSKSASRMPVFKALPPCSRNDD
ncbi:MAG: hypothetical protein AAB654_22985 [Acidobacteriota bacterium]